jgi:hypothetical protein
VAYSLARGDIFPFHCWLLGKNVSGREELQRQKVSYRVMTYASDSFLFQVGADGTAIISPTSAVVSRNIPTNRHAIAMQM